MSAAEEAKQRGNDLFKSGKFRDAVQAYSEAISSDPQSDVLLLNRCAAYMALSDYRRALANAEQAVQQQGETPTPKAIIRLSKCLVGVGRPRDGSSTLQPLRSSTTATEAEQKQAQDVDLLAQQMERHLVTLEAYLREKNWLLAGIALDQAQGVMKLTDASSPKAWQELRAMILLQRGQYSQAQSLAMDMYRSDPSDTDAILLGARVFLANNDVAKAITQAQAALRSDPDRADAKKFLRKCKTLSTLKDEANAAFKANRSDEALAKYAELLQVADTDTDADGEAKKFKAVIHSNRAILLSKLSRFDESIADCTQALQLDAGFVKPLKTRARAYLSSEKYEEAVRDFKRAVDASAGTAEHDALLRECRRAEVDLKRSKKQEYVLTDLMPAITKSWACPRRLPSRRSKRHSAANRSSTTLTRAVMKKNSNCAMRRTAYCPMSRSAAATTRASTIWTAWTWAAWVALVVWAVWVASTWPTCSVRNLPTLIWALAAQARISMALARAASALASLHRSQ